MGNNQEWIGLLGKRIAIHYSIMFIGIVFMVVFGSVGYYFGVQLYNVIKEYMGETTKRKETSGVSSSALGSGLQDDEHYENASEEAIYGASEHAKFTKSFEDMKGKYQLYNQAAKAISTKYNKPITDILDERVMDRAFDNYERLKPAVKSD